MKLAIHNGIDRTDSWNTDWYICNKQGINYHNPAIILNWNEDFVEGHYYHQECISNYFSDSDK